jgi:hypothetical protein
VILVLFHYLELKLSKCLIRKNEQYSSQGPDGGRKTFEKARAPFMGLQVILYLRAGTDSAQPIRVVRESCVKG